MPGVWHSSDDDWVPSTFDHDAQYFPIYSGSHNGEWMACMDCHQNPNTYAEFTCFMCHTQPETDQDHVGINGYAYVNEACLVCHPNGNALDNFDHSSTGFPLLGEHVNVSCLECHTNGFAGTPTDCNGCHMDDYNATTNPNHASSGFGTDCAACHTEGGWVPATFDHDAQFFPIYSGNHQGVWNDCTDCHTDVNNYSMFTCALCHTQNDMDDEHGGVNGYAFVPSKCIECHPNGD